MSEDAKAHVIGADQGDSDLIARCNALPGLKKCRGKPKASGDETGLSDEGSSLGHFGSGLEFVIFKLAEKGRVENRHLMKILISVSFLKNYS